jgi:uncharacterized protein (TIGR02117 family)
LRAFRAGSARSSCVAALAILCGVIGCAATQQVHPYAGPARPTETIYVIAGGWHTELGLPVEALRDPLTSLRPEFPSAHYLVFGWGARDYYMAQDSGIGELLRATIPGPAVMLVIALEVSPEAFFGAANVFALAAPRNGMERLSKFLWDNIDVEEKTTPARIGAGPYPLSVFYPSTATYDLGHTCNTWTAEALRTAGLPVSAAGVVFSAQVLDQLPPLIEVAREPVRGMH